MRESSATLVLLTLWLSAGCASGRTFTQVESARQGQYTAGEMTPKTIGKALGPPDTTEFVGLHALLESVVGDLVCHFRDLPPDDLMMCYDDLGKWFRFELRGRFPQWKHFVLVEWGDLASDP